MIHSTDTRLRSQLLLLASCLTLALTGCGGGTSSSSSGSTGSSGSSTSSSGTGQTYSLSGTVSNLNGGGLVLAVNGSNVTVSSGASTVTLATGLASGLNYTVSVGTQPTGESCSVANASGTIGTANVGNVVVTCSDQAYALSGTISGLNGSGLVLANGSDTLSVPAGALTFTMPTPVAYTSSYAVTIQTQPAGLACAVGNASGAMPAGAVTTVTVSCTDQPFSLGGSISGLGANTGLVLVNGTDTLNVAGGSTSFAMPAAVAFGSSYAVMVQSSPAGLTCSVSSGSGTMPASIVSSVAIVCSTQSYTLGGTVSGLTQSGLVLANGTDRLTVPANSNSFTMPAKVAFTGMYTVTIQTQPAGETCSLGNASGTMPAAAVTSVTVNCSVNSYTIGGTISGLGANSGLVLLDNGGDATTIAANAGQFTMTTGLAYGAGYAITVQTSPPGLTCSVASGAGPVGSANVANVVVTCASQAYALGGSITGLNGSGLVLANGSDTLAVSSGAASFTLPTSVAFGSSYNVTVQTQPAGLACLVGNAGGTMPAGGITNVTVSCTDQPFTLGGTISGLGANTGLVLANGTDTLSVSASASAFTMPTAVNFGASYSVMVQSSPAGLTCSVSNGSNTMPASNVTNVSIVCSSQSFSLGGTISGLGANGLVLANGSDTLGVASGATSFTLPASVAFGSNYNVTVQTQPIGETCSVASGNSTMPASAVTTVAVSCSVNTYTIGGTVSGLGAFSGLVLLDNGGDPTTIAANATQFTMNTGVANGGGFAVTVKSNPAGLSCSVTSGSGTTNGADVTSVTVTCAAPTETVLYSFLNGLDGVIPYGSLTIGADGNFYGVAFYGGANGDGAIFQYNPTTQTEVVLYSFAGGNDGMNPWGGITQAADGNFYGTTTNGGATGVGTLYQYNPTTQIETVIHTFTAAPDGAFPFTTLLVASDGNLYGATEEGGTNGKGTLFQYNLTSQLVTILASFGSGSDGFAPFGNLIQATDGNFYGLTEQGGANGTGALFEYNTTTQTESIVYSFAGGADGAFPWNGLVQGSDGNFYGLTTDGGANGDGTIFVYNTTTQTESVLYSFAGGTDGANPRGSLIQGIDGNLYGMTPNGGANALGTVFAYNLSTNTEAVAYSFAGGNDGASPLGSLIQTSDGTFYGLTSQGGAGSAGSLFSFH